MCQREPYNLWCGNFSHYIVLAEIRNTPTEQRLLKILFATVCYFVLKIDRDGTAKPQTLSELAEHANALIRAGQSSRRTIWAGPKAS